MIHSRDLKSSQWINLPEYIFLMQISCKTQKGIRADSFLYIGFDH